MIPRILIAGLVSALLAATTVIEPGSLAKVSFGQSSQEFSVKAIDQSIVCAGSLVRSGGESGTSLSQLDRVGKTSIELSAAASGNLELREIGSKVSRSESLAGERLNVSTDSADAMQLSITNSADSQQGSLALAANQFQQLATSSIRGLAAASCVQPSNSFYLIGGSTETGRETILVLTNPSPLDATADLRIFTDLGELSVAGMSGISVLANSTNLISLASFAPGVRELVVEVQSQGAKLAGWLQHKVVRGTSPEGVDFVSPVLAPAKEIVIPGLVIRGARQLRNALEEDPASDVGHVLRVFAPSGGSITVQIIASEQDVFGAVSTHTLDAAVVEDIPITELRDGDYTVFISSDQEIFASLRVGRIDTANESIPDFAWLGVAQSAVGSRVIPTSDDGVSLLVIGNSSASARSVRLSNIENGENRNLSIPALGTTAIELSGITQLESESEIFAQLVLLRDGQIAYTDIKDPRNLGLSVKISFR